MKLITKTFGLLIVFTVISKTNFSQQLSNEKDADKQILFQFNNYSIEKDKLLHHEFNKNIQFKISYSCIPTGIVVIGSSNTLSKHDIEFINQKVNHIDTTYVILNQLTLKEVESKCATYRSN